jgi:hypothetical protein
MMDGRGRWSDGEKVTTFAANQKKSAFSPVSTFRDTL